MERLESFEFKRQGRKSFYDWDSMLDGSVWQIGVGDLKDPPPANASVEAKSKALDRFRRAAYAAANGRGLSVQTHMTIDHVVLQATKKGV